jgi:hypothetical protein
VTYTSGRPRSTPASRPLVSSFQGLQRREFCEALLEAASFEELPGKWRAAILKAEQNRPSLRLITND